MKKETMEAIIQEKKREEELDRAFALGNSASSMDCTGVVVAAPVTKEEWEAYEETYHFQPVPIVKNDYFSEQK